MLVLYCMRSCHCKLHCIVYYNELYAALNCKLHCAVELPGSDEIPHFHVQKQCICCIILICSNNSVGTGTDIPSSFSNPVRTGKPGPHSVYSPTHVATSKCDVSQPPYAVEHAYPRLSRLPYAPAKLDPTRSQLPHTLPLANDMFLDSRTQWNRHTGYPPSFLIPVRTRTTGPHSSSTPTHFASSKCSVSKVL